MVKRLYSLTNKQDASGQIASRYHRENHFGSFESHDPVLVQADAPEWDSSNDSPELHHIISESRNNSVSLSSFSNLPDPATKVKPHPLFVNVF